MERIRELRNLKGVSQARLAVEAGMDPATLNRIEQGKGNPNLKTLEKLANALGVSIAELLEEASSPKAQAPLPLDEGAAEQAAVEQRVRGFLSAYPSEEARVLVLEKRAAVIGRYNERWHPEIADAEEWGTFPYGRSIEMRALWRAIADDMTEAGILDYAAAVDAGQLETSDEEQAAIDKLSAAYIEMFNLTGRMREVERTNRASADEEAKSPFPGVFEEGADPRIRERPESR